MRFGGDQPYEVEDQHRMVPLTDEELAAYHRNGTPPAPSPYESPEPARAGRQLPVVPPWVTDTAKWLTLSRTERRKLERHHRKANR